MDSRELKILTTDDISSIDLRLHQIESHLAYLRTCCKAPKVINITDISRIMGVSRTQLLTKQRYLLPYYGRISDFPDGPMRWKFTTWEEWDSRPLDTRKLEYETLLKNDKNKARRN